MEPRPAKRVGRAPVYAEPARKRTFWVPDSVWHRLSREVDIRNLRIDDPTQKLNHSRLMTQLVCDALGIANPARKEG